MMTEHPDTPEDARTEPPQSGEPVLKAGGQHVSPTIEFNGPAMRNMPKPSDMGIEVFTGFKIKYPEYSVITPQTLHSFTVKTLTVREEEIMKASFITPNKLTEHLNDVLYSCLIKKPDSITSIEDFLSLVTTKDRDAILHGLYHVTYKEKHPYNVSCPSCSTENSVQVNFEEAFSATMWEDDDNSILDKEVAVQLEIADQVTVVLKQPTLLDEKNLLENMTFTKDEDRDAQLDLLMVKRFEVNVASSRAPQVVQERQNILTGYQQLPATDKELIEEAFMKNFGKFGIELNSSLRCQKCGTVSEFEIDLLRQFFRVLFERAE